MNGNVQYYLATIAFNDGEELEYFHSTIIRLQQEINLSVETVSHTKLLFQYMKELSNSDKLKAFIEPKITDLITFPEKNGKYNVYIGGNINGIYHYLEMIGAPTTLTTSGRGN